MNLAAFYVVQKMYEAKRMEMGSKKKKKRGKTTFGSPEFAVGIQRDLKLNLGFRDGQNASHLGSGGVVSSTSGEL